MPVLSRASVRLFAVAAVVVTLAGCTPANPDGGEDAAAESPSPVVTYDVSTGYTPTPTPTAARAEDCRIALAALDAATTALNQYAGSEETVAAYTEATASISDAATRAVVRAAGEALGAYMVAPEGADAAEERAWDAAAQAVRSRCA
ncbi:hypothetical protein HQQ81_09135 [Microbacteriaceae bacterium VKM Ac-2854]|nr:hypothetical protein [Microbacteriaceae bacterium VKM Ac-2854]